MDGTTTTGISTREVCALEMGEAEAWADLQRSAHGGGPGAPKIHVERVGGSVLLIAPGTRLALFNRVIGLGIAEPVTPRLVQEVIGCYRQHGAQQFLIHSNPLADQMGLPQLLADQGFVPLDAWAKLLRPPAPLPPLASTTLTVRQIQLNRARLFGRIVCEGFGMSEGMADGICLAVGRAGWFHYLAFDDEAPIGAAAMFVRDGIAWFGIAATLPSCRGRGGQSALVAQRINDAVALGCRHLVAETSGELHPPNPSFRNMTRAGFRLAYLRRNYLLAVPR
ncbi:MAG: GNAT family N-acetyltransferase [Chlorobi bacterium]|nr:GNAT family N-acetyltransferase [Chlorobiota bacterium]MBX7215767.1 GNAT family N-acetyltransferase [Candidatus Kapabacteria bacterium]